MTGAEIFVMETLVIDLHQRFITAKYSRVAAALHYSSQPAVRN